MVSPQHERQQSLENLRNRIEKAENISETDRAFLKDLDKVMQRKASPGASLGVHTHVKYLMKGFVLAREVGDLADVVNSEEAVEQMHRFISRQYHNEETNRTYRSTLRAIGRVMTDGEAVPAPLEVIPTGYSSNYNPEPLPTDMHTWEDVKALIDASQSTRDKAMLAVSFDGGPRAGEFRVIRVKHVSEWEYGHKVQVDGKTGQREVPLVESTPYLRRWLEVHPFPNDPEAPLWPNMQADEPELLGATSFCRILDRLEERTKVAKPLTWTNFRKSAAARLVKEGMTQPQLEDHHGWIRNSDAARRYVATFNETVAQEKARIAGVEIEEDDGSGADVVACPRCDQQNPPEHEFCVNCGKAFDKAAAQRALDDKQSIRDDILKLAQADTGLLDRLDSAEVIAEFFDLEPDTLATIMSLQREEGPSD